MKEKLNQEFETFSSVYDVLPENNALNRKKKNEYLNEEINKTTLRLENVKKEIDKRIQRITSLEENTQLKEYETELEKCCILNEFTPYNTSYEKMHLDYYLYELHRYYKNDFKTIEDCLKKILDAFKRVHVSLSKDDFDFHPSVKEFMSLLLNGGDYTELKSKFETTYWQFPEFINAIEVNFKHIYLKYEKAIEKYFLNRHQAFLSNHKDSEVEQRRKSYIEAIEEIKRNSAYYYFQKFVNKEFLYSDFKESDIMKKRELYFQNNSYSYETLKTLNKILIEYDMILKYDYFFNDLKELMNQKESFKQEKQKALKEVTKEEKNLYKILQSQNPKFSLFKKKKNEDYLFQYKEALNKVIEAYKNLDVARFHDSLYQKFSKDSTTMKALEFVLSNYLYFASKTKEHKEEIKEADLAREYQNLKTTLNNTSFILLNQIALLDEYQMKQVIVDRYHLDGLNLTIESLEADNLENTMKDIKTLLLYEDIIHSNLKLDDVKFYLEAEKMDLLKNN